MPTESIADRLSTIRQQIADAARRSESSPDAVTLIGVSKRQPVEAIRAAHEAGHSTFGENQVQEAIAKAGDLSVELDWHMIGHLQSNKIKAAARLFSTVHSLDRPKVILGLDREAERLGRTIEGFLQVNLGAEASKSGFATDGFAEAAAPFAALRHLRIVGLMAIPPVTVDAEASRSWFAALRTLRDALDARPEWRDHSAWRGDLSMGMSHDFAIAIEEGATHVRVGTALFGARR